ncbi:MAG: AEC family transporter [Clostridia bacterium]|nr:AEC family transporter [Clostridia bacterium]
MAQFWQNAGSTAMQVGILFIMIAVGFIADKTKLYTESTARATTSLMFYIITPCVILNSFLTTEFTKASVKGFFIAFGLSFLAHLIGMALSAPFFNKNTETGVIYKFGCVYGNVGYMALPLVNAVVGQEGILYASSAIASFNILCFCHGIALMNKGRQFRLNAKTLILNPGIIAVSAGLILFLFSVNLPKVITEPIRFIGSMNTPLAMLIMGTYIANADLKTIFSIKEQYLVAFIKLLLVPACIFGVLKLFGITGALATTCVISASAPTANNTVMFSAKYDRDTAVASKLVAFSTLLAIITMPFMTALTQ